MEGRDARGKRGEGRGKKRAGSARAKSEGKQL
jgi:hypothetical protein